MKKKLFFIIILILSLISILWLSLGVITKQYTAPSNEDIYIIRILEQSINNGNLILNDNYSRYPTQDKINYNKYIKTLYYITIILFGISNYIKIDPFSFVYSIPIFSTWILWWLIAISIYFLSKKKSFTILCIFLLIPSSVTSLSCQFMNLNIYWLISLFSWLFILSCCLYTIYKKNYLLFTGIISNVLLIIFFQDYYFFINLFFIYTCYLYIKNRKDCNNIAQYIGYVYAISSLLIILIIKSGKIVIDSSIIISTLSNVIYSLLIYFLFKTYKKDKYSLSNTVSKICFIISIIILLSTLIYKDYNQNPINRIKKVIQKENSIIQNNLLEDAFQSNNINYINHQSINLIFGILGITAGFIPFFLTIKVNACKLYTFEILRTWISLIILLSFFDTNYIKILSIGYGLYTGFLAYYLFTYLNSTPIFAKTQYKTALIYIPIILIYLNYNHNYITFYPKLNNDEQEAYIWILKNTKPTSGYNNDKSPEYGIICDWDYGDKIHFYSKRPTIINHTLSNYIKLASIFCSNDEYEVYKECKKNNYKYLFIQPSKDYGSIIKYLKEKIFKTNNNIINFWEYVTQTLGLISFKSFNSSEHLRLIYIGNTYKGKTPIPYAILEVVDGFNITIKADPYSKAEISLAITLDNINHIYKQSHITNKDGITTFTVPYTTNYISNRIKTDEKYKISCIKKDKIVRKTISIQE